MSASINAAWCHAQLAFDSAADPVYADEWQAGDNGGTGFTPWNFDAGYVFNGTLYSYAIAGIKSIDDGLRAGSEFSNPFNNIGRAWTIATTENDDGAPHIGRGFSPLQVGQSLNVLVDNPTERLFFKGYFVRVNGDSGGVNGNICNSGYSCSTGGTGVPMMSFTTFEYFTNGEWSVNDENSASTGVFDTDTAAAGALFQVRRTDENLYEAVTTSLGGGASFSQTRAFQTPGASIDWIEFVFFNTPSQLAAATDFYINSMSITPIDGLPGDTNDDGVIDIVDLNAVRNGFGASAVPGVPGDAFPFDGKVDIKDLNLVRNNFGTVQAASGAVSEPSTWAMLSLGAGVALWGSRTSRK